MRTLPLLALLLCAPPALLAQAAPPTEPPALPAACAAILAKPYTVALDPAIKPDCDSTALYYGIGRDKSFVAARECALVERAQMADKDVSLFSGPGILSMVYANGEGMPRNLDLARRFVCENKEASTAEMEARLALLDKIAAAPAQDAHFSLCTTASSGVSWGWCTNLQLRQNDEKRSLELGAIYEKLSPEGVEAFKKLQNAEGVYEAARMDKEVDKNGLAQWAWMLQEQDRIRAQFVADLKLFATPDYSQPFTLATVDAVLAKDYANLRANSASLFRGTTLTLAGVDETQAAWQRYRDAWQAYESVVNPSVSSEAVATQLSRERVTQLRKLSTP